MTEVRHESKRKLLEAALHTIRTKGYTATRIDDICEEAGLTKGSFFHHFKSKEALAVAAANYWAATTGALFANAAYHLNDDPLDRVLGYLDFRASMLTGGVPEFTCLVGTMVQEAFETEPAIREACDRCICGHADTLARDIADAMAVHGIEADWTAESLALHTQAVLQGAFVLAKARGGPAVAADSIAHLRRYIALLFGRGEPAVTPSPAKEPPP